MTDPASKLFEPIQLGPDRSTFHEGGERGYTDYPSLTSEGAVTH